MHDLAAFPGSGALLVPLLAGILLLTLGHRLFWLFVGLVGFFAVYGFSLEAFQSVAPGPRLFVAILAGLLGIVLALFVQKAGVALAGFFVGAFLAAGFLQVDVTHAARLPLIPLLLVLAAGILAAFLALGLFDLALILFSSIAGAGLVAGALGLAGQTRVIALVVLALAGILIQAGWTRRRGRRTG
jgi:hypothetical protein